MPPNISILSDLGMKIQSKLERYGKYRDRSFADLTNWRLEVGI
jgi:methylenetetrahydrofolate--tRNA-(uracil-5-)-methyltransferase